MLIFLFIVLFILIAAVVFETIALFRVSNSLLINDEAIQTVYEMLVDYGEQLSIMSKGEVLSNHPEVARFIKLNNMMVENIKRLVLETNQPRVLPAKKSPRPPIAV